MILDFGLWNFNSQCFAICDTNLSRIFTIEKNRKMQNVFNVQDCAEIINRINKLEPTTPALWGKMDVAQMLAHCNVTYEMVYEDKHPKPNPIMKWILKTMVKKKVVTEVPYPKNNPTAPAFVIKGDKDFQSEKTRLIDFINKTQQLGEPYLDGKESHSFGKLNKVEWNCMFAKHLDHHLSQFGA